MRCIIDNFYLHHWQYSLIRPFYFINMTILYPKCHCTAQKHQNKTKTLNLLTYLCVLRCTKRTNRSNKYRTPPTHINIKMINSRWYYSCVNQRIIVFLYFFFVFFFNFNIVTNDADIILTRCYINDTNTKNC